MIFHKFERPTCWDPLKGEDPSQTASVAYHKFSVTTPPGPEAKKEMWMVWVACEGELEKTQADDLLNIWTCAITNTCRLTKRT